MDVLIATCVAPAGPVAVGLFVAGEALLSYGLGFSLGFAALAAAWALFVPNRGNSLKGLNGGSVKGGSK